MGKIKISDEELRFIISSLDFRKEKLKETLYDQPNNDKAQDAYIKARDLSRKLRTIRETQSWKGVYLWISIKSV